MYCNQKSKKYHQNVILVNKKILKEFLMKFNVKLLLFKSYLDFKERVSLKPSVTKFDTLYDSAKL